MERILGVVYRLNIRPTAEKECAGEWWLARGTYGTEESLQVLVMYTCVRVYSVCSGREERVGRRIVRGVDFAM